MIINTSAQPDMVRAAADQPRTDRTDRQDRTARLDSHDKSQVSKTDSLETKTGTANKTAPQDPHSHQDVNVPDVSTDFSVLVEAALNIIPAQSSQPSEDKPSKENTEQTKTSPQLRVAMPGAVLREQANQDSSTNSQSSNDEKSAQPLAPAEAQEAKSVLSDFSTLNPAESTPVQKTEAVSLENTSADRSSSLTLSDLENPVEQARQSWAPVLIKRASSSVEARMDTPAGQVLVTGRMTGSEASVTVTLPAALRPQLSQDGQMPEFQDGTYRWDWQQERDERPKKDSEES